MSGKSRGSSGRRQLKVRVKTAKGRRISSSRWLSRQLNDQYVSQARREGMRSRAAYKLIELDEKYQMFRPGHVVVDLGCAPGGWSQVAVVRTNSNGLVPNQPSGKVIALDMIEMPPIDGVCFLHRDIQFEESASEILALAGGGVDAVVSDMAASSTGHAGTDHLRIMALCEAAAELSFELLKPDGVFVAKVLAGGTEGSLLAVLKTRFKKIHHAKPEASRADSSEKYVVALGYRC